MCNACTDLCLHVPQTHTPVRYYLKVEMYGRSSSAVPWEVQEFLLLNYLQQESLDPDELFHNTAQMDSKLLAT